jgi:predicted O-methyltransferase YrrM
MSANLYEIYCLAHSSPVPDYILAIERSSHLRTIAARMLSGPEVGRLLALWARLLQAQTVIDVGSYTGYSAVWLAEGLAPHGRIHTIEADDEKAWLIKKHMALAGRQEQITLHIGQALDILPTLPAPWDLVYLDADKENYSAYYDLALEKLRQGGLIVADNVLWKGMLAADTPDRVSPHLAAFNQKIATDPRVECQILPIRDGLLWAQKK